MHLDAWGAVQDLGDKSLASLNCRVGPSIPEHRRCIPSRHQRLERVVSMVCWFDSVSCPTRVRVDRPVFPFFLLVFLAHSALPFPPLPLPPLRPRPEVVSPQIGVDDPFGTSSLQVLIFEKRKLV